jgi:hypothetical protein
MSACLCYMIQDFSQHVFCSSFLFGISEHSKSDCKKFVDVVFFKSFNLLRFYCSRYYSSVQAFSNLQLVWIYVALPSFILNTTITQPVLRAATRANTKANKMKVHFLKFFFNVQGIWCLESYNVYGQLSPPISEWTRFACPLWVPPCFLAHNFVSF